MDHDGGHGELDRDDGDHDAVVHDVVAHGGVVGQSDDGTVASNVVVHGKVDTGGNVAFFPPNI